MSYTLGIEYTIRDSLDNSWEIKNYINAKNEITITHEINTSINLNPTECAFFKK